MQRTSALLLVFASLGAPVSASAETWAVFNSKRAMESTEHFKEAKAAYDREFDARKERFEEAQASLKGELEALDAQKAVAAAGAFDEQEKALQKKGMELKQLYMNSQKELQLFDEKLRAQLLRRLEIVVKKYAETSEVTFVVDASKVVFMKPKLDVTDKVLKLYQQYFGDKPIDVKMVKLSDRRGG